MKLYRGDCLEIMQSLPDQSIDLVLCDLPYGTTRCSWDVVLPFDKLWAQYIRLIKSNGCIILFGQEPFSSLLRCSNIGMYKYDIYWEKERLTNIMQVKKRVGKTIETISVFYKQQPTYNPQMVKYDGPKRFNKVRDGKIGSLIEVSKSKKVKPYVDTGYRYPTQVWKFKRDTLISNLHPTQKPVLLLEELIKTYSNVGDLVLDNCMGSGSTGVAAMNTGRDFIGIELEEEYYEVACRRLFGF